MGTREELEVLVSIDWEEPVTIENNPTKKDYPIVVVFRNGTRFSYPSLPYLAESTRERIRQHRGTKSIDECENLIEWLDRWLGKKKAEAANA